jgi:hypothetical protein
MWTVALFTSFVVFWFYVVEPNCFRCAGCPDAVGLQPLGSTRGSTTYGYDLVGLFWRILARRRARRAKRRADKNKSTETAKTVAVKVASASSASSESPDAAEADGAEAAGGAAANPHKVAPRATTRRAAQQVSFGASKLVVRKGNMYAAVTVLRIGDVNSPLTVTLTTKDGSAAYGAEHGGLSAARDEDEAWITSGRVCMTGEGEGTVARPPLGERSLTLTFAAGQRKLHARLHLLYEPSYGVLTRLHVVLTAVDTESTLVLPGMHIKFQPASQLVA